MALKPGTISRGECERIAFSFNAAVTATQTIDLPNDAYYIGIAVDRLAGFTGGPPTIKVKLHNAKTQSGSLTVLAHQVLNTSALSTVINIATNSDPYILIGPVTDTGSKGHKEIVVPYGLRVDYAHAGAGSVAGKTVTGELIVRRL